MRWMRLLVAAASLAAAQEQPKFSSSVQLVMVDVQVTEKGTGKVLDLLGPRDFEVYDHGNARTVAEFHIETVPLDVVFLQYGQGWVPVNDLNDYRRGLSDAVAELRSADRAAVLNTHSESKARLRMTGDKQAIRDALLFSFGGGLKSHFSISSRTHLFDAVRAATTLFPRRNQGARRRAIVALTTDSEKGSDTTLDTLITDLLEADATLNGVILVVHPGGSKVGASMPIPGIPRIGARIGGSGTPGDSIRAAITATGGEVVPGDLVRERLPELIRRIRLRYLLGFYAEPAAQRKFRTIEVRLTPEARKQYPNALVRARRGYYAQPVPSAARCCPQIRFLPADYDVSRKR